MGLTGSVISIFFVVERMTRFSPTILILFVALTWCDSCRRSYNSFRLCCSWWDRYVPSGNKSRPCPFCNAWWAPIPFFKWCSPCMALAGSASVIQQFVPSLWWWSVWIHSDFNNPHRSGVHFRFLPDIFKYFCHQMKLQSLHCLFSSIVSKVDHIDLNIFHYLMPEALLSVIYFITSGAISS